MSAPLTYSTDGPICPHCGRRFVPDEVIYYNEHRYTEQDCDDCGKTFSVSVCLIASWTCAAMPENTSKDVQASDAGKSGEQP